MKNKPEFQDLDQYVEHTSLSLLQSNNSYNSLMSEKCFLGRMASELMRWCFLNIV